MCMWACGMALTPQYCDMEQTEGGKGERAGCVL